MDPLAEMVFLGEIVLQIRIAQRAADRLPVDPGNIDRIEVWTSIQSILVAAGNVSKILWPQKNKMRGEKLRKLLTIKNDNILSDRKFRNHFEHYDDRIDNWFDSQRSAVYRDLAFNPFKTNKWEISNNYHRAYNPVDRILTFRDETLDLKEIVLALEEIKKKCSPYTL